MSRRLPGLLLLAGACLWLLAILSDPLGLGGSSGYGLRQVVLAEVGMLAVLTGLILHERRRRSDPQARNKPRP